MGKSFIEMTGIFLVSIVLAFIVNALSPAGIPLFGNWNPEKGPLNAGGRCEPGEKNISNDGIYKLFRESSAVFVDARRWDDYEREHIPGAVSFPVGEFDARIDAFLDRYPLEEKIVVYCIGVACHDSHELAELLKSVGYTDVSVYYKGIEGWKAAGYPTESGDAS